jgi:fucose 4-O-acetylase-like acetyltransferase
MKIKVRVDWVDYAKGFGILLVVIGHTLRGLTGASNTIYSREWMHVDTWIYSFHMPLFFFLSGFLSNKIANQSFPKFTSSKLRNIAYPYILWTFIIQGIRVLSGQEKTNLVTFISSFWTVIYQPSNIFWFFYALFLISLMHFSVMKLSKNLWIISLISLLLYIFHALFPDIFTWDPLSKTAIYSLYFTCGILLANKPSSNQTSTKETILVITSILGFTIVSVASAVIPNGIEEPYPILAMSGIIASVSIAKILDGRQWLPFLKNWGQLSLQIYVIHTAAAAVARIILKKFLHIDNLPIHLFIGVLAGIYGAIALNSIASRMNWKYLFTFPQKLQQKS